MQRSRDEGSEREDELQGCVVQHHVPWRLHCGLHSAAVASAGLLSKEETHLDCLRILNSDVSVFFSFLFSRNVTDYTEY